MWAVRAGSHGSLAACLNCTHAFAETDAENRTLFVQTKRFCLNVLRVQRGANLLDILERSVCEGAQHTGPCRP